MRAADEKSTTLDETELERLITACATRDSHALRRLYDAVAPQLLACTLRILKRRALAEEVLQEVFVSIWQRAAQFDPQRGRPRAWLVSIARNRAIDFLRSERAELYRDDAVEDIAAPGFEEDADWVSAGRSAAALETCFKQLSFDQRRGIELAFVNGYSHADIARTTGQPLGTIKSWIRRGLVSLRECLEQ
jgi:RNA polymerase sigma factor (sigma-70 family)